MVLIGAMKVRVGIDMDGCIADLHSVWVERYNQLYNDNLKVEDITEWNWHHLTKPECQEKVYKILDDPDLFANLPVIEGSQEVLYKYASKFDIYIVTATRNPLNIPAKHYWLLKNFPFLDEEKFVFTRDKSAFLGDYLIDDKPKNLEGFFGTGILFDAPHNKKEKRFPRVYNWKEVERIFEFIWREFNEPGNSGDYYRSAYQLFNQKESSGAI